MTRLNIGCGLNKIDGFINIDAHAECLPDLTLDITSEKLPYEDQSINEIVFFHCIEHIGERLHDLVLSEFHRVLVPDGQLIISYPEFLKCADAYKNNLRGQREFFKATIYGRQSHAGDFHVSLMDTKFFKIRLTRLGFSVDKVLEESQHEFYNTVLLASKKPAWISREELLREEIFSK